jgi:signal transduction histidine kinase
MFVLPVADPGPWFHRHPRLAVGAATALFGAVALLRFATGDERDATLLLLVLPIALVALAFGLRAGASAAVASVGLLVAWVVTADVTLSALGWVSRVVPLLLLGILIGHASDSQRRSSAVAARLVLVEERQREAAEINDTIVQNLTVAKWNVESGNLDAGVEALEEVIGASQALVVDLLTGLEISGSERRRSRGVPSRRGIQV